jgi:hypothetical protein
MLGYVERVTNDTLIHNGACILISVHPVFLVAGQIIDIRNSQDADSGQLIDRLLGTPNVIVPLEYGEGAYLDKGLFVHIGTAGDYCTVVWRPYPVADLG